MSAKKFATLAVTHDQCVVAVVGGKCVKIAALKDLGTFEQQNDAIKEMRRQDSHKEIAEVFKPEALKGGYRFDTPDAAKKRAETIANQQREYEAAQKKAEADKQAKAKLPAK